MPTSTRLSQSVSKPVQAAGADSGFALMIVLGLMLLLSVVSMIRKRDRTTAYRDLLWLGMVST